jgi:hypothetical protein
MKLNLIKTHNQTFKAGDGESERYMEKIPFGEQVSCKINRTRNSQFHRKFFSLLSLIFENQERYQSFERFRKEVVMRAGFFEEHVHLTGKVSYVAKSLSYEKMDETEFADLFDKCCVVILQHFLPDSDREALEEAVYDYMQGYSP